MPISREIKMLKGSKEIFSIIVYIYFISCLLDAYRGCSIYCVSKSYIFYVYIDHVYVWPAVAKTKSFIVNLCDTPFVWQYQIWKTS